MKESLEMVEAAAPPRPERLDVERFDSFASCANLRPAWDRLYAEDAHATVFQSWPWMSAFLRHTTQALMVLAVRGSEPDVYVALLAMTPRPVGRVPLSLGTELLLAGHPRADYASMLCAPGYETLAQEALARTLRGMPWLNLHLRDVIDPRIEGIVERLSGTEFEIRRYGETLCPILPLPASFDALLADSMGQKTRQHLRRSMKQIAALPGFTVEVADRENRERLIAALIELNHRRWGGNLARHHQNYGGLFRACSEAGCLRLIVFSAQGRTVAALAAFDDPVKRTLSYYMGGYDAQLAKLSPGKAIIGHAIRSAIEDGYCAFDFLRGDEAYKSSFTTQHRTTAHVSIGRRTPAARLVRLGRPLLESVKGRVAKLVYKH